MGKLAKTKGNTFEREVAKIMSSWSGEEFHRLPASGALRWHGKIWTFGDLLPPESFPVVVECKHHHEVSVDALLGNKRHGPGKGQIADWWWGQCVPDAERAAEQTGRHCEPILVWKQDYGVARICIREQLLDRLPPQARQEPQFLRGHFLRNPNPVLANIKHFCETVSATAVRDAIGVIAQYPLGAQKTA